MSPSSGRASPKAPAAATPRPFRGRAAFRAWLQRHHARETELVVRLAKVHAVPRGLTYAEALDEALCFGWIDGVRRTFDADSFTVRFTPRKPRSNWSRVNLAHVERLIREGRMTPSGLAAYAKREQARTGVHSDGREPARLAPTLARAFRSERAAWTWFEGQPPGYRRLCMRWVMSAKREDTRARRLGTLIACSARGRRIPPMAG